MLIRIPFSLASTRDHIAFVLYSVGIWLSFVGLTTAFFVLGYTAQSGIPLLSTVPVSVAGLTAEVGSAGQLLQESTRSTGEISLFFGRFDVFTAFLAFALSFVAVAVFLIFAGYAVRSRSEAEIELKQSLT